MPGGKHSQTWDEFFASLEDGTFEQEYDEPLDSDKFPHFTDEQVEEMHRRRFPPRHPFSTGYYAFDVLDGGAWYRIDANRPKSEFYEGVPESVQQRANDAIDAMASAACDTFNSGGGTPSFLLNVDHTPDYERVLRSVFDDVRFVGTDFEPGMIVD